MNRVQPAKALVPVAALTLLAGLWSISPAHATTYNVKTYGATGDGTTDDSAAIARAINAASANKFKIVSFPAGTYKIGDSAPVLRANDQITLQGETGATLNFQSAGSHMVLTGYAPAVTNLTLASTGSTRSCIRVDGAMKYVIKNNTFNDWGDGIKSEGATAGSIQSNTFNINSGDTGVTFESASTATANGNYFFGLSSKSSVGILADDGTADSIVISSNNFVGLAKGVYANNSETSQPSCSLVVTGNSFINTGVGLESKYLQSMYFDSNTIKYCTYGVYSFYNSASTYTNNTIDTPSSIGIDAGYDTNFLTASNNTITNVGSSNYGIYLYGSSTASASVANNTISGSGSAYAGIYLTGFGNVSYGPVVSTNTIQGFTYGIYSSSNSALTDRKNKISNIQYNAIYSYHDKYFLADGNVLSNCGLKSGGYAVIYVVPWALPTLEQQFVFTNNSYTATTTRNLKYFIYVEYGYTKDVYESGNTTNTMLPSYPVNF